MALADLQRALRTLGGKRAVLVGDMVLDAYIYGETARVSREAPVLVVRKERTEHRLGGAANTAANLAALGLQTRVVSLVGNDEGGNKLRDLLGQCGADVTHVATAKITTPVKTRVLAGAFGTSRQQVLRIDDEPSGPLSQALVETLAQTLLDAAQDTDVVVVSDYGLGLAQEPMFRAVQLLTARGVPVCVDSRYSLHAWHGVTAVTPNIPEAEGVVGHPINTTESVARAGWAIVEKLSCKACLLTQGRGGMTLFLPEHGTSHVDIVGEDEVTDVTGAGDTVIATFAAALAAGLGMENGMRLANVAAGIVVGKLGTATATPSEILAHCQQYGIELKPWDA